MSADQVLSTPNFHGKIFDPALYTAMKLKRFIIAASGFSGTSIATRTTYGDTVAMFHIYNGETAGTDIYLEHVRLICTTAPGGTPTSVQYKWTGHVGSNRRSSGGTDLASSVRQPNLNTTGKAISSTTVVYGFDVTLAAADANTRELLSGSFIGAPVVGTQLDIYPNANVSPQNTTGSDGGGIVIPSGSSGDLHLWIPGAATNNGSWYLQVQGSAR